MREDMDPEDRWRRMLGSECEEGKELARVWGRIRVEVAQCCNFLGEELPLVMATTTIGIGEGSVSGATRGRVVEARENVRAKVLDKLLLEVRPRSTREAWSWRQRDKVSLAWILAILAPDTMLTNAEFSEAAANHLCLPSPACRGMEGEPNKGGG